MKFSILFLVQLLTFIGHSQQSLKNKADSINSLCIKWELIKTIVNDSEQEPPDGKGFFIIKKDENFQLMINEKKLLDGKWKLETSRNIFTTDDKGGVRNWTILKLSGTEFTLETTYDGDKILMILKKAD